jgi:hypothetical protein
MKYQFHSDQGHGWMRVQVEEVERLGIGKQISNYSYVKDGALYLEEDCDMGVFCEAKERLGEKFGFIDVFSAATPIRDYPKWDKGVFSDEWIAAHEVYEGIKADFDAGVDR